MRVWGDFACFTRPEFHFKRVGCPIMAPSATPDFFAGVRPHLTDRGCYSVRVKHAGEKVNTKVNTSLASAAGFCYQPDDLNRESVQEE